MPLFSPKDSAPKIIVSVDEKQTSPLPSLKLSTTNENDDDNLRFKSECLINGGDQTTDSVNKHWLEPPPTLKQFYGLTQERIKEVERNFSTSTEADSSISERFDLLSKFICSFVENCEEIEKH